jgi:tetratricopeptide (TPR) repeat protein
MSAVLASVFGRAQDPERSATLQGTVHDADGKPVAQAAVVLQKKGTAESFTVQTDTRGSYAFTKLQDGIYTLGASKDGHRDAQLESLLLRQHESKFVDLTLGSPQPGKSSDASAPQFFDPPEFTVAGVTDTTNLGGHGSDAIVRTRDSLAKETVSLGEAKPKKSSDEASRANAQRLLATHESADLHHRLADLDEKLGDPLDAVRHYQRAAEMDPSEPHLFDWGAELLLHHAPEPAQEVFSKGAEKYPNSIRMLLGVGAASFARGNSDDAIREICRASDVDPVDSAPYLFLGKIEQTEMVPSNDLIDKLHRFVALRPRDADAHYFYAVGLWKRRNRSQDRNTAAQVESLLKEALQIDPKNAPAELQLGIVEADQGVYAEAISHYQKALATDPLLEEAHYRLAQAYRETGQSDNAREEVRIYGQLAEESAQKQDRERHEIKRFVYTLRDQPAPEAH